MIVVTTPTGAIGHQVVEALLAAGEAVRVIVRDPARLPASIRDRVEVVAGSHGDAAVLDATLPGADALFWLVPPNANAASLEATYLDFTRPAVDAIRRHGVGHVVGVSALGRGTRWADRAGLVTASLAMDDLLAGSGAAYRALAMPSFMDNMLRQVGPLKAQGAFYGPLAGDAKHPTCATRDIAAVAARLLTDRAWDGVADVPVLGPEDLSNDDMARILGEVLGKPVAFQRVPFEAFEANLRANGVSEAFIEGYVAMMKAKDAGMDDEAVRDPAFPTPTTFRRWCQDVLVPAMEA